MNRGEEGRAGTDDNKGIGRFVDLVPEVAADGVSLAAMETDDATFESTLENLDELARQGDFGDEKNRRFFGLKGV